MVAGTCQKAEYWQDIDIILKYTLNNGTYFLPLSILLVAAAKILAVKEGTSIDLP
jgi:hypothetical protein